MGFRGFVHAPRDMAYDELGESNMPPTQPDKHLWLAEQIFAAFPQDVTGLNLFTLDCGCIYFHRVFRDGLIDPQLGVYRDAKNDPCESCMSLKEDWEGRVIDECVVYNSGFQMVDG